MGISAISFSEMQAFFSLNGIEPEPSDVKALEMFDRTALSIITEQNKKKEAHNKAKSKTKK